MLPEVKGETMREKIAGVDEAGRGPLAGPVISGAVILDPAYPIDGLADSKKLSARRRESLYEMIVEHALAWGVGRCEVDEIDRLNILNATMLSMQRAVADLNVLPDRIQVDGNRCPEFACPVEAIVKGDQKIAAISAASIIAKVTRDREMLKLHAEYPQFGFDRHMGYPTALHKQMLNEHGPSPCHRMSYKPVRLACTNHLSD